MDGKMQRFEMIEGEILSIPNGEISVEQALDLHRRYAKELDFTFPSPLNGNCYQVRTRGVVGLMPFGQGALLAINPQFNSCLFISILELVYQLPRISKDTAQVKIGNIFELWVEFLASKILQKAKRGLFMGYKTKQERRPWVKGRMLVDRFAAKAYPNCRFSEHTYDVLENRIIAAALHSLKRYTFKRESCRKKVLKASMELSGVKYCGIRPDDCDLVHYHRLNREYKLMHAMCVPLLRQEGPILASKGDEMQWPAFTVHMPTLFERFCTEYLSLMLGPDIRLHSQFQTRLKGSQGLSFRLDVALFSASMEKPLAVADVKYKFDGAPLESDVQQVVAYAVQLGVSLAYLIYPTTKIKQTFEVGPVQVQTLGFDLSAIELESAGRYINDEFKELIMRSLDFR